MYGNVCREVGHFDLGEGGMLSPFKSHLGSAEEVIASDLRRESRGRKKRLFMAERERERGRERERYPAIGMAVLLPRNFYMGGTGEDIRR